MTEKNAKSVKELVDSLKVPLEFLKLDNNTPTLNAHTSFSDIMNELEIIIDQIVDSAMEVKEERKTSITENETEILAEEMEEFGRQYIYEHYDSYDIKELGSDLYQIVSEKTYENLNEHIRDKYDFSEDNWDMMYGAIADIVFERINFSKIWEAVDDILEAPSTMEDKLRDVGMSMKDFL